jgi:hypothetical protein
LLRNVSVEVSLDPVTQQPSVALVPRVQGRQVALAGVFDMIQALQKKQRILLVLDEFQDIVQVPALEGELRNHLQQLKKNPVILSGSRRHVLTELLSQERRPFYGFGEDVEFGPISLDEWLPYMKKRFHEQHIRLSMAEAQFIADSMEQVPNAIQELCQWLYNTRAGKTLTVQDVRQSIAEILESKASRYLERIVHLREKEKNVLIGIARAQPVAMITQTAFVRATGVSASGIQAAIKRFYDQGVIDRSAKGYFLVDPLFRLFLAKHTA